jgi:hypothetical protein
MNYKRHLIKSSLCFLVLASFEIVAKADIVSSISEYNSPAYDFVSSFPPADATIGNFSSHIPTGVSVLAITISGTFGKNDVFPTTAVSDYFVDGGAIEVAGCDDPTASCFSSQTAPTSANSNPNFGIRLVSVYDPTYPGYSLPVCPGSGGTPAGTYTAATLGSNGQPTPYNNNSGNWRFDEVNVLGTSNGTNPSRMIRSSIPQGWSTRTEFSQ